MSQNIKQIYDTNPATSMQTTDLLYLGRSPYNIADDFAITWNGMQTSITAVGTIATGVWQGTVIGGTYGGTGVNNGASTITIGGNVTYTGAFTFNGTLTGNTAVTFPISGTLATTSQLPTLGTGVATALANNVGSPGAFVVNGGALGTPSSGVLTNTTGLSIAGISATGTPSGTTFLRGDGTWAAPAGSGTVNSGSINQMAWYTANGTAVSGLATANSAVLVTSADGVPSLATTLPNINIGTPTGGVLTNTTDGGGLRSFQVFTSGTAATYTKPANVTSILVEVIGGGGAGGGASSAASSLAFGGGGGGGGYARLFIPSAASTYTYTVGAGGTAGTAGNNPGNSGGTTTFGASLQATGGAGGQGAAATVTTSGVSAAGGAGGVGSNGNINVNGSNGTWGFTVVGIINPSVGGSSAFGGGGGNTNGTEGAGTAGGLYGGGGSGANGGTSTNRAGGAGATGLIIVWEFS